MHDTGDDRDRDNAISGADQWEPPAPHPASTKPADGRQGRGWIVAVIVVIAMFVTGVLVGRNSIDQPKAATSTSTPTTAPPAPTAEVGQLPASGGQVTDRSGVSVQVPAGSLNGPATLSITAAGPVEPLGAALETIGPFVEVAVAGAALTGPLTVTLPITAPGAFDSVDGPDGTALEPGAVFVAHYGAGGWELLDTTVDRQTLTASATLTSLSPITLVRIAAGFIRDLVVSFTESLTGDLLTDIPEPACGPGDDDKVHWTVDTDELPVSWCAVKRSDGTRFVQVANRRRYGITVTTSAGTVSAHSTDLASQLSKLTTGNNTVALAPGDTADVTVPADSTGKVTIGVGYDGLAQSLTTMLVAADILAAIAARVPFANHKTAQEFLATLHVASCVTSLGVDVGAALLSASTIVTLIRDCFGEVIKATGGIVGKVLTASFGVVASTLAYFVSAGSALVDLLTGGSSGKLTYDPNASTAGPAALTYTPITSGVALPLSAWTVVGQTEVTPSVDGGEFVLRVLGGIYWSGLRAKAGICNYRFSGEGRTLDFSGWGLNANTEFDGSGAPVNGHGIQYDPESGGYRDVEYPDVESAAYASAPTDHQWHQLIVEVQDSTYREYVDGLEVFHGTTDAPCGDLYIRMWRTSSEFRNLRVEPIG